MKRKVGIVGGGISGVLACKNVLSKGYHPLVFESQSSIGGVWTKTTETTKLQAPKPLYQFSDYPWPSSVETDFPDHTQVLDYIQSYANHFDLLKHIKLNTKVVSLEYEGHSEEEMQSWVLWGGNGEPFGYNKGKWKLTLQHLISLSTEVIEVDFVILCLGRFSDIPNMPEFPIDKGPNVFEGKVIHSMEYAALDNQSAEALVKAKRITVVGFQKSALDIAMECSTANGVGYPCTVLCRRAHWILPDFFVWSVPLSYLYLNRFAEHLVHKPGEAPLRGLLVALLSPLRWGISKFVESYITKKHRLKKFGMVPEHSFSQQVNSCLLGVMPEGFYENVEEGSIVLKRSRSYSFCKEGLLDDNAELIKGDLVIFATGFKGDKKLKRIFASPKFQDYIMDSLDTIAPLHRESIHPRIPQLAVIGHSESLSFLYNLELRCRWLAELLDEKFKLPNIAQMEKNLLQRDKFLARYNGEFYKRSCTGALPIWYNDQLCRDMGWNPKRKKGFWADLFQPYGPTDYACA